MYHNNQSIIINLYVTNLEIYVDTIKTNIHVLKIFH